MSGDAAGNALPAAGRVVAAKMLAWPLALLLGWWVYRESIDAGAVHSTLAWVAIAFLCFGVGLGLAGAFACIVWPCQVIAASRAGRGACAEPVVITSVSGSILIFMTMEIALWPWVAGAALLVLSLAVIRCMRARIPTVKPPAVSIVPDEARPLSPRSAQSPRWDVFISYRATDSNAVRRVADSMIRQGYRPWFAEYEIPPGEWSDTEAIAQRLAEAVAGSRYFLVFTNDLWAGSKWCNEEMRVILHRLREMKGGGAVSSFAEVMAEVCLPPSSRPHLLFPELSEVRRCVVNKDPLEVWDFLERELGWMRRRSSEEPLINAEAVLPRTAKGVVAGGFTFDLGGLEAREDVFDPAFSTAGWEFSSYSGQWMGEELKLRVLVNPFANKLGVQTAIPGVSDDRAIHRRFVARFSEFLKSCEGTTSLGTHLVHLPRGHAAFGATIRSRSGPDGEALGRMYDIPLQRTWRCRKCGGPLAFSEPPERGVSEDVIAACGNAECSYAELWPRWEHDTVGEIEFSFVTKARPAAEGDGRAQLAALAPLMEAVALSTRRRWWSGLVEWQAVAFRLLFLVAAFEAFRYCWIALSPTWLQALWLTIAGFAAAELVFAVGLPSERRDVMRSWFGGKTKLPLGTWFPRLWNVAKGSVLSALFVALAGFVPMGLIAGVAVFRLQPEHLPLAAALGAATAIAGMTQRPALERSSEPPGDRP